MAAVIRGAAWGACADDTMGNVAKHTARMKSRTILRDIFINHPDRFRRAESPTHARM
jgi:hypothetical protein